MTSRISACLLLLACFRTLAAEGATSFPSDPSGIPDFSYCGYDTGRDDLPEVPAVTVLHPEPNDSTARIQEAIDKVAAMPLRDDGFRGTIELRAGVYCVTGTLRIRQSGIVIRGRDEGRGRIVIRRVGGSGDAVVLAEPESQATAAKAIRVRTTGSLYPKGSRRVEMEDVGAFSVGDRITIVRPSTEAWLYRINASEKTGEHWTPGRVDCRYDRTIVSIQQNTIEVDAPLYSELDRATTAAYAFKRAAGELDHIGIEGLEIEASPDAHAERSVGGAARVGIRFSKVSQSWIRDVTVRHHSLAAYEFTKGCGTTSVLRCRAMDPARNADPNYGFGFRTKGAQLMLFRECLVVGARYGFIACGGSFDSGLAFVDCTAYNVEEQAFGSIGHWAHALLFDRAVDRAALGALSLAMNDRKRRGDGESGWCIVDGVAWRCDFASKLTVDAPPYGSNWAIACRSGDAAVNIGPPISVAGVSASLSLYETQQAIRRRQISVAAQSQNQY